MKKSKILFFILGALVFSLSACNVSNENSGGSSGSTPSHEHTYSSSWNYDNTYHWHDATCGHDVVSSKERHTFNDVVTPASYSAGGYTTHTCTVCGYSYTDSQTDQLVHHYESGWSHDESTHWHACTDSGYEHLKSGESSHTFNDVVTPASYSAGGYTTHTCTVCGYSYVDSETSQLPITITWKNEDGTILEIDENVPYGSTPSYDGATPTKTEDGQFSYTFVGWSPVVDPTVETTEYTAQFSVSLKYLRCQYSSESESYAVIGYKASPSNIEIPEQYNDGIHGSLPVTKVEDYAFYECESLISLIIPDSVTYIGINAFESCSALKTIKLSDNITSIQPDTFKNCTSLKELSIPSSVMSIAEGSLFGCSSLESLSIPYVGLTPADAVATNNTFFGLIFGKNEFNGSSLITQKGYKKATSYLYNESTYTCSSYIPDSLKDLKILDGAYTIHRGALSGLRSVENLYIGNVLLIDEGALNNSNFVSISLPYAGNAQNASNDSKAHLLAYVFGNKSGTSSNTYNVTQYCYNSNSPSSDYAYTGYFPTSLNSIEIRGGKVQEGTLHNLSTVEKVVIGSDVTEIYTGTFKGMLSLKKISVPFLGREKITYYTGAVEFDSNPKNYCVGSVFPSSGSTTDYNKVDFSFKVKGQSAAYYVADFYIPKSLEEISVNGGDLIYGGFGNIASYIKRINIRNITYNSAIRDVNYETFEGVYYSYKIDDYMNLIGSKYDQYSCNKIFVLDNDERFYNPNSISISSNSVETIKDSFFMNNANFESIELDDGVVSIEKNAFYGCTSLNSVKFGNNVETIGESAFYGCTSLQSISLPSKLTRIETKTFYGCSALEEVVIPEGVTYIGSQAFYDCSSLKRISLPSTLKTIESSAFSGCSSLDEIVVPDGVETIGTSAFTRCSSLKKVVIPNSVTNMNMSYAFQQCPSLEEMVLPYLPNTLGDIFTTHYSSDTYDENVYYIVNQNNTTYRIPTTLKKITINGGTLASQALKDVKIENMVINNVDSVGSNAFENCSSLQTVSINGCKTIGDYAFKNCANLISITIDSSLEKINGFAFSGCTNLTTINYLGTTSQFDNLYLVSTWNRESYIERIVCSNGTINL